MHSLKTMTLAAVALAGAAYAVDAAWAAEPMCEAREVSLYFEKGASDFNSFSQAVVERVAREAKSCSGAIVIAEAPNGGLAADRSAALAEAFDEVGVTVIVVGQPRIAPQANDDTINDRTATVRLVTASEARAIG